MSNREAATTSLADLARTYLVAGNHSVVHQTTGFVELRAPGTDHPVLIWADDSELTASASLSDAERRARDAREAALLVSFEQHMGAAEDDAVGFYLTPRRRGLSTSFVTEATRRLGAGGGVRVPIEFFDSEYRRERVGGEGRYSAISDLIERAGRVDRVPQPFFVRTGLGAADRRPGGDDLVAYLVDALTQPPTAPRLRLVDGSAGMGKTVAFNALVAATYPSFIEAKSARIARPRPIAFNERHLRKTGTHAGGRVHDLIASLIATEVANPVTPAQFDWLVRHGFSAWLFDGLDEVYAGDATFFHKISTLLDAEGSVAQVLLCTRDSLLTSSEATREFIETRLEHHGDVEILELAPWGETAWRSLAGAGADGFVRTVSSSAAIGQLATLPFYAVELLRLVGPGEAPPQPVDEFAMMDQIVARMLERERGKDIFEWGDFVALPPDLDLDAVPEERRAEVVAAIESAGRESLVQLVELIAHFRQRTDAGSGDTLPVAMIQDLLAMSHATLDPRSPEGSATALAVVQFAFFGLGGGADSVDFSHPMLADHLAARYALRLLRASATPGAIRQAVGSQPVPRDSLFHRRMARAVADDPSLRAALRSALDADDLRVPHVIEFVQWLLA